MAKTKMILVISTLILTGCMFLQQKLYPIPANEVIIKEDTIYCAGKPFAKLVSLDFDKGTTFAAKRPIYRTGLVIYYYNNDKEVWIHPKKGLTIYQEGIEHTKIEDMQQVLTKYNQEVPAYKDKWKQFPKEKIPQIRFSGKPWRKEDAIRSVVYNVRVSSDGKYVYYTAQGMIWNSSYTYLVEYGVSR